MRAALGVVPRRHFAPLTARHPLQWSRKSPLRRTSAELLVFEKAFAVADAVNVQVVAVTGEMLPFIIVAPLPVPAVIVQPVNVRPFVLDTIFIAEPAVAKMVEELMENAPEFVTRGGLTDPLIVLPEIDIVIEPLFTTAPELFPAPVNAELEMDNAPELDKLLTANPPEPPSVEKLHAENWQSADPFFKKA